MIHNQVVQPGKRKHQEEGKELKSWQAVKKGRLLEEKRDARLLSINLYHMET
jgi:hypothetical protein